MTPQPANVQTGRGRSETKISSLDPVFVIVLLLAGAVGAFVLAAFGPGSVWARLTLCGLALAQLFVAFLAKIAWKRVALSPNALLIADGVQSESLSRDDLMMVVQSRVLLWNACRVHFKRRTCFGWSICFVPTNDGHRMIQEWRNEDTIAR